MCNENGDLCLIYKNLYTIGFNEYLHGFEVEDTLGLTAINLADLYSHFPAIIARLPLSGTLVVATKFAL